MLVDKVKPRVLLIEDDAAFRSAVKNILVMNNFLVTEAATGKSGMAKIQEEKPDLVILDLILPGTQGFEICRELKMCMDTAGIPVLILTGNDVEGQEIACLDMGADDYLAKPVKSERLLARCRALLRRTRPVIKTESEVQLGPLKLDHTRKLVTLYGMEYSHLTPKEFSILYELAISSPMPLDQKTIYRKIWEMDPPSEVSLKTVEVHIRRIRLKMSWWSNQWLTSIHGRGYCLIPPSTVFSMPDY